MKKKRRDAIAKELGRKYGVPYLEIRKEVSRQISYFALSISEGNNTGVIVDPSLEEETILSYIRTKYEDKKCTSSNYEEVLTNLNNRNMDSRIKQSKYK